MSDKLSPVYGLSGGLLLLLLLQFLWGEFVAYPVGFERMLRRGRSWVYIPLRWRGFYKVQIQSVSRLLLLAVAVTATFLLMQSGRRGPAWIAGFALFSFIAAVWLQALWNRLRYRQQEDAYFLQLDELRAKLESENKDYTDSQLRNLAAYQHQQRLRKADEEGKFLAVLRQEARRFRQTRANAVSQAADA